MPGAGLSLVYIAGSDHYTFRTAGVKFSSRIMSIWRRGKAKVNHLLGNKFPKASVRHESDFPTPPPARLGRLSTPPTRLIHPPTVLTPPIRRSHTTSQN